MGGSTGAAYSPDLLTDMGLMMGGGRTPLICAGERAIRCEGPLTSRQGGRKARECQRVEEKACWAREKDAGRLPRFFDCNPLAGGTCSLQPAVRDSPSIVSRPSDFDRRKKNR